MIIRKLRDTDSRRVSNLIRKTLLESNRKDYTADVIRGLVDYFTPGRIRHLSGEREIYVVVQKGRLLATGSLDGNWILNLFVRPQAQGRGIGSKLLAYLERRALNLGHCRIIVPSSLTGLAFYQANGYRTVHDKAWASEDSVKMAKRLNRV